MNKMTRILSAMFLATVMVLSLTACGEETPDPTVSVPTTQISIPDDEQSQAAFLGDSLYITDVGNYTGAYMEDGTDEFVSNVLMIVLKNENTMALQLARIHLVYSDFTADFEVTNLPAGESVVLLEKNRHAYVEEKFMRSSMENVVFFQTPMSLCEDQVKLTGGNGEITVENLSDQVLGEVFIYYKNSAVDLFYGGITYRARLEAGLQPGDSMKLLTTHYYQNACTIIDVRIMPAELE